MSDKSDDILARVAGYYDDKVLAHGATPQGADWRDVSSQELRFSRLMAVMRGQRAGSLAEIGCGWGAFPHWAKRNGIDLAYTGYDISQEMLREAERTCRELPNVRFIKGDRPSHETDYVIASGIFNVRFDAKDEDWLNLIYTTVDRMYHSAKVGIAFNLLTSFSDSERMEQRLYYADPGLILNHFIGKYGRHVALNHGYGLYEFTVCIWKVPAER